MRTNKQLFVIYCLCATSFDAPGRKSFREFNGGHESALVRFPEQWKTAVTEWLEQFNFRSDVPFPGGGTSALYVGRMPDATH
jgi:hypothetical protein